MGEEFLFSEQDYVDEGLYDPEVLEQGVETAIDIIDDVDMETPYVIKPYTDFDGPVRTRGRDGEEYHSGVKQAFDMLIENEEILNPGIISGRGVGYLLAQAERLGLSEIDVAGEMGASYFLEDDMEDMLPDSRSPEFTIPREEESMEDIYAFNLALFESLAESDLQLMYGDNRSNVVGSACIEAFGANLEQDRFSVEDTVYADMYDYSDAQSVREQIESYMGGIHSENFEFYNHMIRFDKSLEASETLTTIFMANPFIPWGFHDEGDRIAMFPDYRADKEFTQKNFEDFVNDLEQKYNENAEAEFWTSTYHDHSFDFGKKGYENLKTRAAEKMMEDRFIDRPILYTNTGDKPTDILDIPESIFFAQSGTEAQEYCEENDIPYVEVDSVVDSFMIQAELVSRIDETGL